MGSTELGLALKYGVPLVVKLLADGKKEEETVAAVADVITNMATGGAGDAGEIGAVISNGLLGADEQQTKNIIDGLFGVLTGVMGAIGGLLHAFTRVFGGN